MKWTEVFDIAMSLEEKFPHVDILSISFKQLQQHVMSLKNFDDEIKNCNERVLEAIQQAWLDERR